MAVLPDSMVDLGQLSAEQAPLKHFYELMTYEAYFNDRLRTALPQGLAPGFMPENAKIWPMLWVLVPVNQAEMLLDQYDEENEHLKQDLIDPSRGIVYFPIHPLMKEVFSGHEIIESGKMRASASYRTVFFEPEIGGVLSRQQTASTGLMVKLHLDAPLPGIKGDRRLTRDKVAKCITVSGELHRMAEKGDMSARLEVIREPLGIVYNNRGAILRRMPAQKILPVFSLFSRDRRDPATEPLIVQLLKERYGRNQKQAASGFGTLFAVPFLQALFSAFVQGFSLEMHSQNTLVSLSQSEVIDKVYYRDMEGVVFSNQFRRKNLKQELFQDQRNPELHELGKRIKRYFNRNLDYDLSRIWINFLDSIVSSRYFGRKEALLARHSIQEAVRMNIKSFGLQRLAACGKLLRVSRTPYDSAWYRRRSYYRCFFR